MPPTPSNDNLDQPTTEQGVVASSSPVEANEPFPSLAALRATHNQLLEDHRTQAEAEAFWQTVEMFLLRGRATGTLLDSEDDRWAAQSLLDYWSATAYSVGREMPDAALDDFDPNLAPEIPDELCPYVGLAAFRETQEPYYFGRNQLVETLVTTVATDRLVAVIGPSGSGKSSLVLAGLLPSLRTGAIAAQDGLPSSDQWRYSERMVPGSDPLANLAHAITPNENDAVLDATVTAKFIFAADGCREETDYLVKLFDETGETPYVLVIDQFEELFTLCTDETLRHAFIENLLSLIQSPGTPHRVILTMRTDFESFVARLPNFQSHFEEAIVRVTPLNASELRAVIERPAAMVGLKFEEGVVDALVQDVLGEPAALPLLQFTLLKLWERRERNRITWDSYKELGGGRLALSRSADQLYEGLIPEEQITARRILLRLVRPGEGLEITSNRVRRSVLYQTGEARDRVDRVLDRLIDADLLRLTPGEKPEDAQIEVAHEALVRNWPRLVGWLEDERGRIRERLRLTEAAEQWLKVDRDPGALLRGTLLEDAQHHPDLSQLEEEYVQASLAARQAAAAEREATRQRELEQARALAAEQQERAEAEREWAEYQTLAATKLRQRAWLLAFSTVAALLLATVAVLFYIGARTERANAIAARLDAEVQAATADAAAVVADAAAATAVVARQNEATKAAEALTAREDAEAAQAMAIADANLARTAEAVAVAEQTKVAHARSALADTVQDLTDLLTMVAPTPTPPSLDEPATPTPTATPALAAPSADISTDAPPVVASIALSTAVEAYANLLQQSESASLRAEENEAIVAASTVAYIVTDTVVLRSPLTLAVTLPTIAPSSADERGSDDDEGNDEGDNEVMATPIRLPSSELITDTVNGSDIPTATTVVTNVVRFLPNIQALVPDIAINLYAEANEKAEILRTIQGPMSLPILQAGPDWVQVVVTNGSTAEQTTVQPENQQSSANEIQIGWVRAWKLNYQGDRSVLPVHLRYLVIEPDVPFVDGTVISLGDESGYPLLPSLENFGVTLEDTEWITVPVGTEVTVIAQETVTPIEGTDSASSTWFFVSFAVPGGLNQLERGYLPTVVIAPRAAGDDSP